MSDSDDNQDYYDPEKEARKIRELFKGRFTQDIAKSILDTFNGRAEEAVDFLLNESEDAVLQLLHKQPGYLDALRRDSAEVLEQLQNGVATNVRQFACGVCKKQWWRKVPIRKEVSKCRGCKTKFDPVPREKEWGWGHFECHNCGNAFNGFAAMGETISTCYKCGQKVPDEHILPPMRNRQRKKCKNPHNCNGVNCFNRHIHMQGQIPRGPSYMPGSGGTYMPVLQNNYSVYPEPQQASQREPHCYHPKSMANREIRWASKCHVSTGSTVTTCLSQGSIETSLFTSVDIMDRIDE